MEMFGSSTRPEDERFTTCDESERKFIIVLEADPLTCESSLQNESRAGFAYWRPPDFGIS